MINHTIRLLFHSYLYNKKRMKYLSIILLACFFHIQTKAQNTFQYEVLLKEVSIPNLPGFHSYAFAQAEGKILLLGGRLDGLHARQPFNSFPNSQNNTNIYVIDIATESFWSSPLSSLSTNLQEQLQATNMNFHQEEDTLFIIGGYAYSASNNDHITFPFLTSVQVSGLINAIIDETSIVPYFKQIEDNTFAVTGGHLGKIDDEYLLVGGHRFDGRYNPMGNPTFTQTYTNKIQKFTINNSGTQLSFDNYSATTDAVHLHRRDYNLVPQIFSDGNEGYLISSGVFQINVDLPFLYPVEVRKDSYSPITSFSQYLSNYHSAIAAMYDNENNEMHQLFFGGMSQHYYDNETLVQDDAVPFVKTISLVTRKSDDSFHEYVLPIEMPNLEGASAEFIPNTNLEAYSNDVVKLNQIQGDTFTLGHILGGINSTSLNPFDANQTNTTSASSKIFEVQLIKKDSPIAIKEILLEKTFDFEITPNPVSQELTLTFNLDNLVGVDYFISNTQGEMLSLKELFVKKGRNEHSILLDKSWADQYYILTLCFDNQYYISKKFLVNRQ